MLQKRTDFAENLTQRQIVALPHLLRPGPITEQARNAGISRNTLYRWFEDENFRECLERLREETLRFSQSEFQAITLKAVEAINDALDSNDIRIRLQAARIVMQESRNAQYDQTMQRRVENLFDAFQLREERWWRHR